MNCLPEHKCFRHKHVRQRDSAGSLNHVPVHGGFCCQNTHRVPEGASTCDCMLSQLIYSCYTSLSRVNNKGTMCIFGCFAKLLQRCVQGVTQVCDMAKGCSMLDIVLDNKPIVSTCKLCLDVSSFACKAQAVQLSPRVTPACFVLWQCK